MHAAFFPPRARIVELAMLCAALALPQDHHADAFNLDEGASWSGAPSLPIQVHLGAPSTLGGVAVTYPLGDGFATFDDSFIQAIRLWNHYLSAGPGPVMTPTVGSGAGSQNDGINTMFFSSTVFGQAFGSNTLAVTVFDNIGSQMTEADIMFNTAKRWDSYRGNPHFVGVTTIFDLQRVAIHELGHLLGLDHPDQAKPPQFVNAIMNSTIGALDIMANDDIKGINVLYNGDPLPGTDGTVGIVTNLSTRLDILNGSSVAIPGFIVTGTGTKTVLVRAIGPSLSQFGIVGALQAPTMELHDAGTTLATNTGWKTLPQATQDQLTAAGLAPTDDAECAILMDLPASTTGTPYTVVIGGVGGTTGVGRVDIIDFNPANTAAKLTNVSTRGQVQTGQNVMIGGFIINGTLPKQTWVRALGPSLSGVIPGTISDPTLTIFDSGGNQVYVNNDWQSSQQAMIQGSQIQPGNAKESAVMINLPPGAYTVVVSGVGGVTGNGRVDIYDGDNSP